MKLITLQALIISILFFSCNSTSKVNSASNKELTKAERILAETIEAHGGKRYDNAHYEFIFRKNKYTFKNSK